MRSVEVSRRRRGIETVKNAPLNHELISEIVLIPTPVVRRVGRFQVIPKSAAGVCISDGFTDSPEEARSRGAAGSFDGEGDSEGTVYLTEPPLHSSALARAGGLFL